MIDTLTQAKTFEDFLARNGELLHRIQNRDVVLYTKMGKQLSVCPFVYSSLEASQVDRDSIRDLVIEGSLNTLS